MACVSPWSPCTLPGINTAAIFPTQPPLNRRAPPRTSQPVRNLALNVRARRWRASGWVGLHLTNVDMAMAKHQPAYSIHEPVSKHQQGKVPSAQAAYAFMFPKRSSRFGSAPCATISEAVLRWAGLGRSGAEVRCSLARAWRVARGRAVMCEAGRQASRQGLDWGNGSEMGGVRCDGRAGAAERQHGELMGTRAGGEAGLEHASISRTGTVLACRREMGGWTSLATSAGVA
ncbi:hypothetical protein BS50DRAFT_323591 [Corynespora cassiicola Philippines]|uniref:Uncharacterized protein n=1 Tax=Corynespora cassiicola Philippines TaxID=1448308 RepID=A0A2T2NTI9_CORCC|nr:hypothetical protein BS50DRAFT_323591 [Corynespora cassiicola Philippines]